MTAERPADVTALVGRCGQCLVGGTIIGTRPAICSLPSGHGVWHRSDEGTEWGFTVRDDYADIKAAARAEGYEAGRADAGRDVAFGAGVEDTDYREFYIDDDAEAVGDDHA